MFSSDIALRGLNIYLSSNFSILNIFHLSLLLLFICLCVCFNCGIALFVSELSASYPPCVRIVVQASDVVDVGTFFLVPCTGGTIGRDKDPRHVIQIQDINMSKVGCAVLIVIDYLWHPTS